MNRLIENENYAGGWKPTPRLARNSARIISNIIPDVTITNCQIITPGVD